MKQTIDQVFSILHQTYPSHPMHDAFGKDPWQMLVAVMLSQRATDLATIRVCSKLFAEAPTVQAIHELSIEKLEKHLYSIGFFRQKARALKALADAVHLKHNDQVPIDEKSLLALPQIGRKTANIILTLFGPTPQIAVDIHVHRITNRLGWVKTATPAETERSLTPLCSESQKRIANQVFVRHGQEICRPISPKCSSCPVSQYCKKIGVTVSR